MRPIIHLATHELDGRPFIALNLFDERGQHADQIVKQADELEIIDTVIDLLRTHKIDTVDVHTDSESAFKAFLSVPGVNVSFALPAELQALHDLFAPYSTAYLMIRELYDLPETKEQSNGKVSVWTHFLNYLRGLIKHWKKHWIGKRKRHF